MSVEKPRFRRDLEAVPIEADGERYVEVRDLEAGWSFCFYDFEYRVALAFDGLALNKVIPWVKLSTGLELRVDQLQAFAASLGEMGFLEGEPGPTPTPEMPPSSLQESTPMSHPQDESLPELSPVVERAPLQAVVPPDAAVPSLSSVAEAVVAEAAMAEEPPTADEVVAVEVAVVSDPMPGLPPAEPAPGLEATPTPEPEPEATPTPPPAPTLPPVPTPPSVPTPEPEPVPAQAPAPPLAPEPEPAQEAPVEAPAEVTSHATAPSDDGVALGAAPPANLAMDSTAFPVLPAPASRAPTPGPAPSGGPPSWTTPRPLMTPVPVTFGPIVEPPSARRRLRRSLVLFGSLGVLAAVAVLALALPFLFSTQEAPRPRVRVLVAAPGSIFRYFDGAGAVQAVPGLTLKFPAPGKVAHAVSAGSTVAAGDIAAAVESARPLQEQLTRQRERLAFNQQMAEAMHQVGNTKEEERHVAKVELRNARIAKLLGALAEVAVVVAAPGEVETTLAHEGDMVEAGTPALRLLSSGFRATFELPRQQAAQARRLGFCQVEVEGYLFECAQTQESSDETHASVDIALVPPALLGKPAHLARARFEGAYVLPLAAITHGGSRDEVLVVSTQSRALARPVTVAERDATLAVVVQGLDVGDHVIVESVPGLRAGAQVTVVP